MISTSDKVRGYTSYAVDGVKKMFGWDQPAPAVPDRP
jgi:hypothetical protein